MAIKTEVMKVASTRRTVTVSSAKDGRIMRMMNSRGSHWHKHGTKYVVIGSSENDRGATVSGKEAILRLREFLDHVCEMKKWK